MEQYRPVMSFDEDVARGYDRGLRGDEVSPVAFLATRGYLHALRGHQYVDAEEIGVDKVGLDVACHDPVNQRLEKNHVSLTAEGIRLNPVVLRYAWPSELDLMARIAGRDWRSATAAGTAGRSRPPARCTCPSGRADLRPSPE